MTKKKENRISVNALDEAIKNTNQIQDSCVSISNFENFNFTFKKYLTIQETVDFVSSVIRTTFINNVYYPELYDFAFKSTFIEHITNLTLPNNINKSNDFIYGTDLFKQIYMAVEESGELLKRLNSVCREHIELNNKKTKFDDLCNTIIELIKNYDSKVKDIDIKSFIDKISSFDKIDEKKLANAVLKLKKDTEKNTVSVV